MKRLGGTEWSCQLRHNGGTLENDAHAENWGTLGTAHETKNRVLDSGNSLCQDPGGRQTIHSLSERLQVWRKRREQVGIDSMGGQGAYTGSAPDEAVCMLKRGCDKVPWPCAGTGWLPIAVSKSITPSTDFRLVYLECMEFACQTSALAIKHAMVTIALPCVSATRVGNNHKCQKRERMGKESCATSSGKRIGLAAPLWGPASCTFCCPAGGRGIDVALASSCPFC